MNVFRSNCIAVVGASSQIGRALLPRLTNAGYTSLRIGREDRSATDGFATYVFDQESQRFTPTLNAADTIISLAPLPSIDLVVNMAQALGARRIIAFGSTGRFSKANSTSKIEQEFVAQQEQAEDFFSSRCREIGIGWTLFRPTMIYGADADQNVSFIKSMVRKFGFFPIPIGANGRRQPVHVNDLADACLLALNCKTTLNKAYNLGGGEVLEFPDLVKRIFAAENKRACLVPLPMIFFTFLLTVMRRHPKSSFVRKEMIERMYVDLIANNEEAEIDFNYNPQPFIYSSKAGEG